MRVLTICELGPPGTGTFWHSLPPSLSTMLSNDAIRDEGFEPLHSSAGLHRESDVYTDDINMSSTPPTPSSATAYPPVPSSSSNTPAVSEKKNKINPSKLSRCDFYFGRLLGEGSFARVMHAKMKPTIQGYETLQQEYAIKIMEKAHIMKEDKVKYVMMERKILNGISHHFIIKMYFSFQDSRYLYMCMDLAPGGELFQLIIKKRNENEEKGIFNVACDLQTTVFYSAEICEALCYLHSKHIIHRDLKPENIILDEKGHIKLADFGTAYNGDDEDSATLERFVGTAEYVTPELLTCDLDSDEPTNWPSMRSSSSRDKDEQDISIKYTNDIYVDNDSSDTAIIPVTKACDFWAMGCIAYQMLYGKTPFKAPTEYLIFENIKKYASGVDPITYPHTTSEPTRDIIEGLLRKEPTQRYGSGNSSDGNSYQKLQQHPFFREINWETLHLESSPHIPDPSKFPSSKGMYDGANEDWDVEGEATPIGYRDSDFGPIIKAAHGDSKSSDHTSRPSLQPKVVYTDWMHHLVREEKQIFTGLVWKRKGLFSKKRRLVLTDAPRLFYVDPDSMEMKGEIPWTKSHPVSCRVITRAAFDVVSSSTGRSYHLTDAGDAGSVMWVDLINAIVLVQRDKVDGV